MKKGKRVIGTILLALFSTVVLVGFVWALSSRTREIIRAQWVFEQPISLPDSNISTPMIADDAVTTAKILNLNVTPAKLAADCVGTAKVDFTAVAIAVNNGSTTGTGTCESGAAVLGYHATSNMDQFVDSVAISGTTITVTLAGAATNTNNFSVITLNPE